MRSTGYPTTVALRTYQMFFDAPREGVIPERVPILNVKDHFDARD